MQTVGFRQAQAEFDHLLDRIEEGPISIEDEQGRLCVMISAREYQRLEAYAKLVKNDS